MKLHRLALRNLNSLRGTHVVDFDRDLHDAPIFLIHGPTGAGKSTLMDAVSLALFASTPRLDSYNVTGTDDLNVNDGRQAMTRGTGDCEADLIFSRLTPAGRRFFRARWAARRARNRPDGKFQAVERSIEELESPDPDQPRRGTGAIHYAGPKKTLAEQAFNQALGGMDVTDFRRSMLLAQGDFARFLNASPAERASILERITDTSRFTAIGARAAARYTRERQAVDRLEAELDGLRLLTEDERRSLARRQQTAERAQAHWEATLEPLRTTATRVRTVIDRARTARERAEADRLAAEALAQRAPDAERLKRHRQVRPAAQALAARDGLAARAEGLKDRIEKATAARAAAVEANTTAEGLEKTARTAAETAERTLERARPVLAAARRLAEAKARHRASGEQEKKLAQELADAEKAIAPLTEALAGAKKAHDDARARLDAVLQGGEDVAGARGRLEEKAAGVAARIAAIDRAVEASERLAECVRESEELEKGSAADREKRGALTVQCEQLERERKGRDEHLETARELERVVALRADLADRRAGLEEGEPCPLCGAEDHPHAGRPADAEREELERARARREALEKEVRGLEKALRAAEKELAAAGERLAGAEKRAEVLAGERAKRAAEVAEAWGQSGGEGEVGEGKAGERLAALREVLAGESEGVREERRALEEVATAVAGAEKAASQAERKLRDAGEAVTALRGRLVEVAERCKAEKAAEEEAKASLDREQVAGDWALGERDAGEAERELANGAREAREKHGAARSEMEKAGRALAAAGEKVEVLEKEARGVVEELREARARAAEALAVVGLGEEAVRGAVLGEEEEARLAGELEALERRAGEARVRAEEAAEQLGEGARGAVELEGELRRLAVAEELALPEEAEEGAVALEVDSGGEGGAEEDRDGLAADGASGSEEGAALDVGAVADGASAGTEGDGGGAGGDVDEREGAEEGAEGSRLVLGGACVVGDGEVAEVLALLGVFAGEDREAVRGALTAREGEEAWGRVLGALEARVEVVHPAAGESRDRAVEARTLLGQDDAARVEREGRLRELEMERERLAVWRDLHELIGVGSGDRFRDFAQSLNLERILGGANVHLAHLAPRYRLVQRMSGSVPLLDFAVRDEEQAGEERPITTLSGGESFLCSLALALGLAGMRQGRLQIETLLLDEGFGTLDASSLALAIAVLEQLHARGFRVGVISHVAALRERIPARIEVQRVGGSFSRLVVHGRDAARTGGD